MRRQTSIKTAYVWRKALEMLLMLLLLSVVVFVLARLAPGDPLRAYYGDGLERLSQVQQEAARERLGLNDSLAVQYLRWAEHALQGDWGISFQYKQPVTAVIGKMWQNTLLLGGISFALTFWLAAVIGKFCALHEGSFADRVICKIGTVSGCIPTFFLALLLILIFAVNLRVLPVGGAYDYGESGNALNRALHLILPTAVTVLEHLWYYAYLIRNKLAEEARGDYVLLCKAKGMPARKILAQHCMKNILPTLVVMMAVALPHILCGTYIVETVFAYPGLGKLSFESAMYQDYNLLTALCLLTGAVVFFFQFLAQVLGEALDPRMKAEAKGGLADA